jgi:ATP-binding cassette, subfamily B, bacterial
MPRVPLIPQLESGECGAVSLAMILAYHGRHVKLTELREACAVSRDLQASAAALVQAARDSGMEASGVRVAPGHIASLPLPAILHWAERHFVVLERVRKAAVTIADPAEGRRVVPHALFNEKFTGIAIVLRPGPRFQPRAKRHPARADAFRLLRQMAPTLARIFAIAVLVQMLSLALPIGMRFLIDEVILPAEESLLIAVTCALALATVMRIGLNLTRGTMLQHLQRALDFELMTRFCSHLLHLPASYFLQRRTGDLAQRVESATVVRSLIATQASAALLDVLLLVGYASLMATFSLRITAIVLLLGVGRLAILVTLRRRRQQLMSFEQTAAAREASALVDAFSAWETTKACGLERYMFDRWASRASERIDAQVPRQRVELASTRFLAFLQTVALALVFWLGGHAVIDGRMTLGTFTALLTLHGLVLAPLGSLLASFDQYQYLGVQLMRVDDVLESSPEPNGVAVPERLRGALDIQSLSFAYRPMSARILHDINLRIDAGRIVAIVGPVASGKSTLAKLLVGVLQPTSGHVRVDGHDVGKLDVARLRHRVGVVPQETFLLDDTVRANLCLGHPDAPFEAIERAAWCAGIDEVIAALPHGYDTRLGENGLILSAGQRQRLAIARALVHEPALLVLDEATSALDVETEARVCQRLGALSCTRIVITHRVDAIDHCDEVIVLERGRIVQMGHPAELKGEPGLFRDLVLSMRATVGTGGVA